MKYIQLISMKKTVENKTTVQSLDRAFDIIEALGNSKGRLSITNLCSITGLHKSTIHRLLATLKERGYISQDDTGSYRLTFKICLLSRQVIDGVSLVSVAKQYLKSLCDIAQETVHLAIREGNRTVYLHREECSTSPVRIISNVGLYRALHTTAVGKSIMAAMSDDDIAEYWRDADKTKVTPNTIDSLPDLLKDIAETRMRGFAIDNEENTLGVRCIAVALADYMGNHNAGVSVSGYKDRMNEERMRELRPDIIAVRDMIMADLGHVK